MSALYVADLLYNRCLHSLATVIYSIVNVIWRKTDVEKAMLLYKSQ